MKLDFFNTVFFPFNQLFKWTVYDYMNTTFCSFVLWFLIKLIIPFIIVYRPGFNLIMSHLT